jgi:hypothetical protein
VTSGSSSRTCAPMSMLARVVTAPDTGATGACAISEWRCRARAGAFALVTSLRQPDRRSPSAARAANGGDPVGVW